MKRKFLRAFAWVIVAALCLGIVTDFLCALGLVRGWQYLFNFAAFLALPFLVFVGLGEKTYE